jgi:magnesium transporter
MITTICYRQDSGFRKEIEPHEISDLLDKKGNLLWIDATDPSFEEIQLLQEELGLHPLAIEDLNVRYDRPKIEEYDSTYYMVVYAAREATRQIDETLGYSVMGVDFQRLNLFVGRNFLLTIHDKLFKEVNEVLARWERNSQGMNTDVGIPVYSLLDSLVDNFFPVIDDIADRVDEMEDKIFEGADQQVLRSIFVLKKDLLSFRRLASPLRDVVNVLLRGDIPIFAEKSSTYFRDVYDHLVRIIDSIDTYRDLMSNALDTYLSVTSNKLAENSNRLNITMQTLTAWSIMLMSAGIIAGIYGMNFKYMPELSWFFGYPFALLLITSIWVVFIVYFKRMKWL